MRETSESALPEDALAPMMLYMSFYDFLPAAAAARSPPAGHSAPELKLLVQAPTDVCFVSILNVYLYGIYSLTFAILCLQACITLLFNYLLL